MTSRSKVEKSLTKITEELSWVEKEVNDECDKNSLSRLIDDVKQAISDAQSEFDYFESEVSEIFDDYEESLDKFKEVFR